MEEGKSYYFYCVLRKRINRRCGRVMLARTRLLHSRWLYKPASMYDYIFRYCAKTLPHVIITAQKLRYDISYHIAYLNIECKYFI